MKKTHFVQFWASWWHVVPRLFFWGDLLKLQKQQKTRAFDNFSMLHKAPPLPLGYLLNTPQCANLWGFVPFGSAPRCTTFFSWEFTENSTSSKHEKDTLPFGTRMQPQGNRQDKTKLKATAVGSYNRRSNGYWNSWPYLLLRRSNCYFYSWFRFSRVLVCYIALTLASTNLSFDRSGS